MANDHLPCAKGLTGPKEWDGKPIEGSFRAHQIPIPVDQNDMEHADKLVAWLKSYRPEELFDESGKLKPEFAEIAPKGDKRMAANPHTNPGKLIRNLILPDFREFALENAEHGKTVAQDMTVLGKYLERVIELNAKNRNFRIFGPDETMSNRLAPIFDETKRQWMQDIKEPNDEFLAHSGRIIDSQLSEHQDEGFLEGYVLTGRHGFFASYEAFLRVVDSMLTQHFKWLRKAKEQPWRSEILHSTSFRRQPCSNRITTAIRTRILEFWATWQIKSLNLSANICRPMPTPCSLFLTKS